jgi:hypothetical protein
MLLFIPLHASNETYIRGWWRLKITGPLLDYNDIKECYIKVSDDDKTMTFSSVHEDQYRLVVEYCGKNKKECKK